MARFNLFAYGTLRGDGNPAGVLAGCSRAGSGTVPGILYDIEGRFPALVMYGDAPVRGEIWNCPAPLLLRLDEYEGVGTGLFRRVGVEVQHADGRTVPCWIYAAGPALSRHLTPDNRIADGVWPRIAQL